MFAGKTTELIRRVALARASQRRVVVLKPTRDSRSAADEIATHSGTRFEARSVECAADMVALTCGVEILAIDEVHFFGSELVSVLPQLLTSPRVIIVSGCDLDHFGEVFEPFPALLQRADEIVRLNGCCAKCGAPSTHTQRKSHARERIVVGGSGEYEARCAACFIPTAR